MRKYSILFFPLLVISITASAQRPVPGAYSPLSKVNYVRIWDVVKPTSNSNDLDITTGLSVARMITQYFDGLGRPIQTTIKQGSLVTGSSAVDMVTPVIYDEFGRETFKYLPFAANNTGSNTSINDGLFKQNPFQQQAAFSATQYPAETFYYSQTNYEPSPLNRVEKALAPGNSWVGAGRGTESKYWLNTTVDEIRVWKVDDNPGGLASYSTPGTYPQGELFKNVTVDERGNQVIEFKDKDGQVIVKKVQFTATADDGNGKDHLGWLCTYYIYDDLHQLRGVIQPRGVELLKLNSWNLNALNGDILNEQCFRYEYDDRRRMIVKKVPGAGEVRMVYDSRDRLVLTQDANLRASNTWLFTKYDALNRPICTGKYVNASYTTQQAMQGYLNGQSLAMYETYTPGGALPMYTLNQSFPVVTYNDILTATYYDDYGWTNGVPADYRTFDNSVVTAFYSPSNTIYPYPQPIEVSNNTRGLVTGTIVKTLDGTKDLVTTSFYDVKGRVIQVKAENYTGACDVTTTQYSFIGQPLMTYLHHVKYGTNSQRHDVLTRIDYDDLGRVLTIRKTIGSSVNGLVISKAEQVIVSHEYNELGQLKKKKQGNKPGVSGTALAGMEYAYNIRGWMLSINKDYVTGSTNNDQYFGMELGYDRNGSLGTFTPQYNGNIGGTIWKNETDQQKRKYDFGYDAVNRLTGADYTQYVSGSGASAVFDRSAGIDYSVSNLSYDANGNTLSMQQKGWKLSGSTMIDNLSYNYYSNSNRLKNVIDGSNDEQTKLGDFRSSQAYMTSLNHNKTASATDYSYDGNGNLVKDFNKDIGDATTTGIEYNHLNLPAKIQVKNKGKIEYVYDAMGNKLKKTVTEETASPVITTATLYLGGFEYRNDTLQQIAHEEGRIRLEKATINTCPALPERFVYDYFVKDHLGNVRMVLTEEQPSDCYPAATLEDSRVATEEKVYNIIPSRIVDKASTGASQSSFENKLYRVHGGLTNEKTGLGIVLKVMSGDKVIIKGESYYNLPGGNAGSPLPVALTELLSAFVGSGPVSSKGVAAASDITGIAGNTAALNNFISSNNPGSNTAKAAINWLLLDEQFRFVTGDFDGVQVGGGYKNHVKFINNPVNVTKSGYLYIYVSNESNLAVFFDNLQVTHTRGAILETNEYYPFGLMMAGISSRTFQSDYAENRKKYNGIEFEGDVGLNVYDAQLRELDPQIGRWWEIDPKVDNMEMWTPYASNYDNPISFSDPLGDEPEEGEGCCKELLRILKDAAVATTGAVAGTVVGAIDNNLGSNIRGSIASSGIITDSRVAMGWNLGLDVADAGSIAIGGAEATFGGELTASSLAVTAATGGLSLEVTGPTTVVGGLITLHGLMAANNGIKNLVSQNGRVQVNSNSNSSNGKGSNNPTIKESINKGNSAHKDFKAKVQNKSGWQAEPRIKDPQTGKTLKPDAMTPGGKPVELKPNTKSGRAKGARQIKKYENATGQSGKVIYYDPAKIKP